MLFRSPTALELRFLKFLAAIPGSESLDDLLRGSEYDGERRADYLLFDRRVIVEVKSLETDTSPKAEEEMSRHEDREDFPLFFGKVEIHKILRHLPDGQKINERIFVRTTRSVEDAARSAEDQIANTARLLDFSDAVGIMVLLNEDIQVLAPDLVVERLSALLRRKKPDGSLRSPIAYAWLLFENHVVVGGPSEKTLPMIALQGPLASSFPWFAELLNYLEVSWAQYNGRPLFQVSESDLNKLQIVPASATKEPQPGDRMSRQDLWRHRYRKRPHLRLLPDAEVLRFGRIAFDQLMPYFLKGGPRAAWEEMEPHMIKWSDFLCEAEYRGLDLRHMREA